MPNNEFKESKANSFVLRNFNLFLSWNINSKFQRLENE